MWYLAYRHFCSNLWQCVQDEWHDCCVPILLVGRSLHPHRLRLGTTNGLNGTGLGCSTKPHTLSFCPERWKNLSLIKIKFMHCKLWPFLQFSNLATSTVWVRFPSAMVWTLYASASAGSLTVDINSFSLRRISCSSISICLRLWTTWQSKKLTSEIRTQNFALLHAILN